MLRFGQALISHRFALSDGIIEGPGSTPISGMKELAKVMVGWVTYMATVCPIDKESSSKMLILRVKAST